MFLRFLSVSGGALLTLLLSQASAQTASSTQLPVSLAATDSAVALPAVIDPNLPGYSTPTVAVSQAVIPTSPKAPVDSRLYAGAAATFGSNSAYGIVIGSTQVFSSFGAQASVEYSAKTGAILVDTLLTLRPRLLSRSKLRPYVGVGVGLSSSTPVTGTTTTVNGVLTSTPSVTDYTAQALVGGDYMFTKDIAAYAEAGYRHAFSSKGLANGAGGLGRLGVKFFF